MKKDYSDWMLHDIENAVGDDKFIEILKYVLNHDGGDRVLEVLKASGFFISIKDELHIEKKQREVVKEFVKRNLEYKCIKKYDQLIKEAKILKRKQKIINDDIYDILHKYKISLEELILKMFGRFKEIDENVKFQLDVHSFMATKENVILALGSLLKTIVFYSEKSSDDFEKIPPRVLEKLINAVLLLRIYNEIIYSWMFGEICIEYDTISRELEIEELPGNNKDRLVSAMSYFDIKDMKDYKAGISNDNKITEYIEAMKAKIKEYFYTNDYKEKYLNIELNSWIIAYAFFAKESNENKTSIVKYKKDILVNKLKLEGISIEESEKIISYFIFSKKSKDLFDSFLINIDNDLVLIPEIYLLIDPSRAMMSLFGKHNKSESGINQKGTCFEKHIYSMLKIFNKSNIGLNIGTDFEGNKYEVDIVFEFENNLFFCECKTQAQHENMREYFKNKRELECYLDKFKRNYDFFTENEKGKQKIKNELGIDNIENCYRIFISNIVFRDIKHEQIFITDEARIYRYMNRIPACAYAISGDKKVEISRLFTEFYEGDITVKQFIEFLMNKQEEIKIDKRRITLSCNETLKNYGILSKRFIVDYTKNYLKQ